MQLALTSAFEGEAACQLAETLILVLGVVAGWLVWSAVQRILVHSAVQQKESALLQETSIICKAEDTEQESTPVFSGSSSDEDSKVMALFEHYGLFGAPVGAWNNVVFPDAELEDGYLDDPLALAQREFESSKDSEVPQDDTHSRTSELFEHYGLFGAPVGAWSSRA